MPMNVPTPNSPSTGIVTVGSSSSSTSNNNMKYRGWIRGLLKCTNPIVVIGTVVYLISFHWLAIYYQKTNSSNTETDYNNPSYGTKVTSKRELKLSSSSSSSSSCLIEATNGRTMIPPPQQQPVPVQWNVRSDVSLQQQLDSNNNVTYPIFMSSLPKSGTTSVWKYFLCGKQKASHNWIQKTKGSKSTLSGLCIRDNILANKPPFDNCGDVDVYTDTGFLNYALDTGIDCYFPSIQGLEAIYHSYPNATFIHAIRKTEDWYKSLQLWSKGSLFIRFRMCNVTGFPNGQSDQNDFYNFYEWHNRLIRQFVFDRPSINYIEIELDNPNTGTVLEQRTGIPKHCWKHCRPDSRLCEQEQKEQEQQSQQQQEQGAEEEEEEEEENDDTEAAGEEKS